MIAGGAVSGIESSVQILDVSPGLWRMSAHSLPHDLVFGQVVEFGDTFLVVCGKRFNDEKDEILQFNPDDETWTIRTEKLSEGKIGFYAIMVDESFYDCVPYRPTPPKKHPKTTFSKPPVVHHL